MTFEDRRSPAAKEEAARDYAEWTKSLAEAEKECDRWRALCWASGVPWQVIETCPFKALDNSHGFEGAILVTDGKSVALASVSKRFGRCREANRLRKMRLGGKKWRSRRMLLLTPLNTR